MAWRGTSLLTPEQRASIEGVREANLNAELADLTLEDLHLRPLPNFPKAPTQMPPQYSEPTKQRMEEFHDLLRRYNASMDRVMSLHAELALVRERLSKLVSRDLLVTMRAELGEPRLRMEDMKDRLDAQALGKKAAIHNLHHHLRTIYAQLHTSYAALTKAFHSDPTAMKRLGLELPNKNIHTHVLAHIGGRRTTRKANAKANNGLSYRRHKSIRSRHIA